MKYSNKKYYQILLLIIFLFTTYSLHLNATIRYVSKSGTSTPPYLTWQTAADSIQKCINISVVGDTIYVANGVYQEQVVMIPGLSLIGAGMDSCVIYLSATGIPAVQVADTCILTGFKILLPNTLNTWGIQADQKGYESTIKLNRIVNASLGIYVRYSNPTLYNNTFQNIKTRGIWLFNSNSITRRNFINTDPNSQSGSVTGIFIEAFDFNCTPIIDSNYIIANYRADGIYKAPGTRSTITNNEIIMKGGGEGIFLHYYVSDSNWVHNNLIYAEQGIDAIYSNGNNYLYINNNYATGNFDNQQNSEYVISVGQNHTVKNNVVTNAERGVEAWATQNLIFKYNNVWNNGINYYGFIPDTTNLSVDPMIVNDDTTRGELDFHLQKYSPLIDAGDPTILDRDGSRSDIGLYGGPYGWTYTYQDLAPRPPHNVTAAIEDGFVKLSWNKNTEADFSHYRVYRDTVSILIYDSTKIRGETIDTFYYDNLPPVNRETRYYYVITAFDNQGNQSYPSEEINVLVTGLGEQPPIGYNGYRLLSNYPNPFNPSTIIPYRLKERGHVRLSIYDLKGELVRVLVNEWQERGYYEVMFQPNAEDKSKITKLEVPMGKTYSHLSSGMYIYSIQVIDESNIPVFTDSEKMILLK
jgi:parallel beta-helix repeat protein